MDSKRCSRCYKVKPLGDFHRYQRSPDGRQNYCKVCTTEISRTKRDSPITRPEYLAQRRQHYQDNRERLRAEAAQRLREFPEAQALASRKSRLKKTWGLTLGQYDEMVDAQMGRCHLCHRPPTRNNLAVDHDHVTGRVRMLLCDPCNLGIGSLRDDPELLRRAADYIERFRT